MELRDPESDKALSQSVRGVSLSLALIGFIALIITLTLVLNSLRIHHERNKALEEEMGRRLLGIVTTVSTLMIDGDNHEEIHVPEDYELPEFKEIRSILRDVKIANGLDSSIYTLRRVGDHTEFVVMTNDPPYIGNRYVLREEMIPVFEKGISNRTMLYSDQHGDWISAYGPIRDSEGNVVALLELDYSVTAFMLESRQHLQKLITFAIISFVVASALGVLLIRALTRPILALIESMSRVIHTNNLNVNIEEKGKIKEFNKLSRTFNIMTRGLLEKEKIRNLMNLVVSKDIAEEMLKGEVKLGGEEREVTTLFSDIRGFTAMSENMSPTDVIIMLNEYMTCMTGVIESNNGVVDKYVGDEIMAIFGAPVSYEKDAESAVKAAVEMMVELRKLNDARRARSLVEINAGIGMNTGVVVAGNMGSETRLNYTVIGDNVNVAARLCSEAEPYQILVSKSTRDKVMDDFEFNPLEPIFVKGKAMPLEIFEVADTQSPYKPGAQRLKANSSSMVVMGMLAELAEKRGAETGKHPIRVAHYTRRIAEKLAHQEKYRGIITKSWIKDLFTVTPLHDIGKVGVFKKILLKDGEWTDEEFEAMKTHTYIGEEILEGPEFPDVAREVAGGHHEKWDGSGYPRGLAGEAIPLSARIVALADAYDVLVAEKDYKEVFTHQEACDIILGGLGKDFDLEVVEAFREVKDDFININERYADA